MNPPKERNHTITEYSLTEKHHIGKVKETEVYYDLMSAIIVCLGKNEEETEYELLRLLDVLLSPDKKAKEKKEILENEFQIPMTEKMETEVEYMCNLSDGVEQKGIEKGIEKEQLRLIQKKLEKNKSIQQIAEEVELDVERVKSYIEVLKKD
jgi:predicted transposase YdaD